MNEDNIQPMADPELMETPDVQEIQETPDEQTPAPSPASREDIAGIVTEALSRVQPQQVQQPPRQLTPEEIEERLRVAKFDDTFATQLHEALNAEEFNPKQVVGLLHNMRDGLMTQAQTYVQLALEKQRQDLEREYAPMRTAYQQQQQEAVTNRFFKTYSSLKPFERLIPNAAQEVVQSGKRFASEADEFRAIAEAAERLIRQFPVGQNFRLGQAKSGGPKPASAMRPGASGPGAPNNVKNAGCDPALV